MNHYAVSLEHAVRNPSGINDPAAVDAMTTLKASGHRVTVYGSRMDALADFQRAYPLALDEWTLDFILSDASHVIDRRAPGGVNWGHVLLKGVGYSGEGIEKNDCDSCRELAAALKKAGSTAGSLKKHINPQGAHGLVRSLQTDARRASQLLNDTSFGGKGAGSGFQLRVDAKQELVDIMGRTQTRAETLGTLIDTACRATDVLREVVTITAEAGSKESEEDVTPN